MSKRDYQLAAVKRRRTRAPRTKHGSLRDGTWEFVKFALAGFVAVALAVTGEVFVGNDASDLTCDHIVPGASADPERSTEPLRQAAIEACYRDLIEELTDG